MFRYRMSSNPPRYGWVLAVFIIGILLIILAGQLGTPQTVDAQPTAAPGSAASTSAGSNLLAFWGDIKAGAVSLWERLTGADRARQVNVDLGSTTAAGAGTDEEDIPTDDVTVEVENPLVPDAFVPLGLSPQILIYHTHTHEAYTKLEGQDYVEVAKWRTVNNSYNVVRVGEALAMELSGKYGIAVLQDKTDTEYPKLGTSYSRSLKTLQKNIAANRDLKILIDMHRDAYNTGINPSAVTINGKKVARIMFVIGTGVGQTGVGFTDRPDWKKNLRLADAIKNRLILLDPQLVRETSVKTGRYNQHVSTGTILIEVGHNQNTLEEALNAVPFLAQAIAGAYCDLAEAEAALQTASAAPSASAVPQPTATAAPSATPSPAPSASPSGTPATWPTPQPTDSPGPAPQVITIDPVNTDKPRPVEDV